MKLGTAVNIAICLCFYHLGGMATTNILRLLKGSETSVKYSKCNCPVCGKRIRLIDQLPIVSYVFCGGKCRKCKSKIPLSTPVLEVLIFVGMSLVAALFEFSVTGVLMSFVFYEVVRACFVLGYGKRENNFRKEYIIAMLMNITPFLLIEFLAVIKWLALKY